MADWRRVDELTLIIKSIQERCAYIGHEFTVSEAKLRSLGITEEEVALIMFHTAPAKATP